jgi:hypothetical protein
VTRAQYLILAYSAGLGLLTSYATGLWIAAWMARRQATRLATAKTVVKTVELGGVL